MDNGISEIQTAIDELEDNLAGLKDLLIKQGHRIKLHPLGYRCPECQAVYVGKANYGKHLEEDHSYGVEAIYVDMENQQMYYDTGIADLERLLEEYTDVRIDADS